MLKKTSYLLLSSIFAVNTAMAEIKTKSVEYQTKDGKAMQGYMAYDDTVKSPQPGIIIVSDWMGLGKFAKEKAQILASQGYIAFAADVYGKGIQPTNQEEASKLATKYKNDRPLLRSHIQAAFDKLTSMKEVNPKKIVVMGYCFGGTVALELARSGAPLVGTASFHGGLANPTPDDAKNIKGRVLIMHGADDPNVPSKEVEAFKEEMKKANVNMVFIAYPNAVHAFTNPDAGNDNSKGVAYNEKADKASWQEFEKFLKEVF
jgi:dienelactone hydrolase